MPLDTLKAIQTRYSCRAFTDKLPPMEELHIIAKAGVASPSAVNRQPWRIIMLTDPILMAELEAEGMKNLAAQSDRGGYNRIMTRGGKLYYGAPAMALLLIPKTERPGGELLDCGIVTQNVALAATSLGIDNLICGMASFSFMGEKGAEFRQRLGFPDGFTLGIAVLLGYAENPHGQPHEPDESKISFIG